MVVLYLKTLMRNNYSLNGTSGRNREDKGQGTTDWILKGVFMSIHIRVHHQYVLAT